MMLLVLEYCIREWEPQGQMGGAGTLRTTGENDTRVWLTGKFDHGGRKLPDVLFLNLSCYSQVHLMLGIMNV